MNSSFHHQGLWKLPVDPPIITKIPLKGSECTQSSDVPAATQGAQERGPLRNTVDIDSSNVIDYPPDQFWKKIIASISFNKVFIACIYGDFIRDRYENMTLALYCSTYFVLTLVFISSNC